jgi:hypothetical protein
VTAVSTGSMPVESEVLKISCAPVTTISSRIRPRFGARCGHHRTGGGWSHPDTGAASVRTGQDRTACEVGRRCASVVDGIPCCQTDSVPVPARGPTVSVTAWRTCSKIPRRKAADRIRHRTSKTSERPHSHVVTQ